MSKYILIRHDTDFRPAIMDKDNNVWKVPNEAMVELTKEELDYLLQNIPMFQQPIDKFGNIEPIKINEFYNKIRKVLE